MPAERLERERQKQEAVAQALAFRNWQLELAVRTPKRCAAQCAAAAKFQSRVGGGFTHICEDAYYSGVDRQIVYLPDSPYISLNLPPKCSED
ncbi:MAG: hypothetical protein C4332_13935 [Meiothermus sp.]